MIDTCPWFMFNYRSSFCNNFHNTKFTRRGLQSTSKSSQIFLTSVIMKVATNIWSWKLNYKYQFVIFFLSVNFNWAVNVPFPWKQTPHIFIILFLQAYQSISKHNIKKLVFLPVNVKIISYSAQIDHILTSSRRRVSSFRLSKSTQIIFIFIRS